MSKSENDPRVAKMFLELEALVAEKRETMDEFNKRIADKRDALREVAKEVASGQGNLIMSLVGEEGE